MIFQSFGGFGGFGSQAQSESISISGGLSKFIFSSETLLVHVFPLLLQDLEGLVVSDVALEDDDLIIMITKI